MGEWTKCWKPNLWIQKLWSLVWNGYIKQAIVGYSIVNAGLKKKIRYTRNCIRSPTEKLMFVSFLQFRLLHESEQRLLLSYCLQSFFSDNMKRLKTREWKTRDGRKVTLKNAGCIMQDYRKRENVHYGMPTNIHLSICNKLIYASACGLSVSSSAFSSVAGKLLKVSSLPSNKFILSFLV